MSNQSVVFFDGRNRRLVGLETRVRISQMTWDFKSERVDAMVMGVGDEHDDGRRPIFLADRVRGNE